MKARIAPGLQLVSIVMGDQATIWAAWFITVHAIGANTAAAAIRL